MTERRWTNETDDTDEGESSSLPEPDFVDARPGIASGSTAWGEPPRGELHAVEEVLDGVLGRFAGSSQSILPDVVAAWPTAAGPGWEGAIPVALTDDTLIVEVPDGTTASQLQFDTTRLVGALRTVAGGRVRKVRFRVARR